MANKNINRWQETIKPRDGSKPWTMGPGGSFDMQHVEPIPDSMLVELAQWMRMGYTPWNGRSMPLSDGDREFMYLLYFSSDGLVARMRAQEKRAADAISLLRELVALKEMKHRYENWDTDSATSHDEIMKIRRDYEDRKPAAWEAAAAFLVKALEL